MEITETVLVSDMAGASSELHHLTVDTLKIDRTFISDLDHPRDQSLIRMITDLGHHIGATIVTEGVETTQQLRAVQDLGCDQVQG